jgi:two-component system, OmpR family, sensor histidine kinase KdpD
VPISGSTSDPLRPDPDALLASLRRESARDGRGRLTIFFGMAPGVGKTYAMLTAARRARAAGIDVLVGLVETHGRAETAALLEDLPLLPRRAVLHRDTTLHEFDLEAALARRPRLILVDELAHTNAPSSRHLKRHQDVAELLAAGIDVFTTLNVQHLESRADTVRQITGAPVHETVPDSVIEAADDIQLVDLTPAQLRERLAAGKVYLGDRAAVAAENFFKETHLTALRELALRLTAERVDQQLRDIRESGGTRAIWRSGERLLVAVGPSPFSTRLVRWTRRMAYALDAPWLAVAVETGETLPPDDQRRLDENLALARQLGAEVIVVSDRDVASALLRAAHRHNVSQIVVGKPRGHPVLEILQGGSLVDRLVRGSGQIDIYVVPAEPRTGRNRWLEWNVSIISRPQEYALAAGVVAAVTVGALLLAPYAGYSAAALLYLTAVIVLGRWLGQGPIFLAATLSALTWNFAFIPPLYTFRIFKLEDGLTFGLFFVIALITGRLTTRIRAQSRAQDAGERRATALYQLTRDLAAARSADEVIRAAVARIAENFGARPAVLIADSAGRLSLHPSAAYDVSPKESGVALWALQHRRPAGRFTDTLPASDGYYVPLVTGDHALGVLGICPPDDLPLTLGQRDLLDTFAAQLALALEREQLRVASESARLASESEKLHRALLDSVSHELKTPLAVITGSSEALLAAPAGPHAAALTREIDAAARRLQRLVNNLLDVTRLESGALRPRLDWCDLRDIINAALDGTADLRREHPTTVNLPDELPPVRGDFALLEQAVFNLLHNAAAHTPAGTAIEVTAHVDTLDREAWITVADRGPGLPAAHAAQIFDRFARGNPARAGGLGLGLSIVRGFAEAHGGRIEASANPGGGARFTLFIPWTPHDSIPSE